MKIAIIGYSGSGKSTLARSLAERLNIPVLHLDTVQFCPNWVVRDVEEGRRIVKDFLNKNESWVIDGNYQKFYQKERFESADKIIFLNFPRRVCIMRAYKRLFMYKGKTRPDMTAGCKEKIDLEFLWWLLYKGRTRKRRNRYRDIAAAYNGKFIELKNSDEVRKYIEEECGHTAVTNIIE